jgi:hypothetical protein
VVHTVGEIPVSTKTLDQENPAVLVKGARHPDRERKGDRKVEGVTEDGGIHGLFLSIWYVQELLKV